MHYLTGPASIVVAFVGVLPAFKYILWWTSILHGLKLNRLSCRIDVFKYLFVENYDSHETAFDGKNRDFIDSLLISKKEAEEEEKDAKQHLNKYNI